MSPCYEPGIGLGTGDTIAKKTSTFPALRKLPLTYYTKGLALNNSDTGFRKLRGEQSKSAAFANVRPSMLFAFIKL